MGLKFDWGEGVTRYTGAINHFVQTIKKANIPVVEDERKMFDFARDDLQVSKS